MQLSGAMRFLKRYLNATALSLQKSVVARMTASGRKKLLEQLIAKAAKGTGEAKDGLRELFAIQDLLEHFITEQAMALGKGVHPKHQLTRYHDFFIDRIPNGSRVLDIGCGIGAVARSVAERVSGAQVTGIDLNAASIAAAISQSQLPNLSFRTGDAIVDLPEGSFEVLILSNILEHIEDRKSFLGKLRQHFPGALLLIRVPAFERHWHVAMRRYLGLPYMSDRTHFIEHSVEEFELEMSEAGLLVEELLVRWGEIWATCRDENRVGRVRSV